MSSVLNPVGPEQPSTYWRRRAVVIAVLLAVVALFWVLVRVALGSADEPAESTASPSPSFGLTIAPDPDPSASAAPDASASPGAASASPSTSPSPSASAACADSDISVVAGTSASSTAVGAGIDLTLSIENTGDEACTRDFGAGANEVRISSGSVLVWSSDFCNPSSAESMVTLDPGEGRTTSVTWPGTVTARGCPADQPPAQPGSYRAVARNGSVESDPVRFTIK